MVASFIFLKEHGIFLKKIFITRLFISIKKKYPPNRFWKKNDGGDLKIYGGVGAGPHNGVLLSAKNTTLKPGTKV
ncbi:hypothetical protein, partial [Enterobacter hormaechei]